MVTHSTGSGIALWTDRTFAGAAPRGGRPTMIRSLATYVPPRVLSNADLEKMLDTTDEWIMQRVGIRERHIAAPGRRDVGPRQGSGARGDRAGGSHARRHRRHRGRHRHAGHDVSEHRLPHSGQDRRASRVGLRHQRRLLGVHLLADDGEPAGGDRGARARAGGRRRRDVEHPRLHRPLDLRAVRRRRRRGRGVRGGRRRRRDSRFRARDRRQRRRRAVHAGRRQPAAAVARDRSISGCTT